MKLLDKGAKFIITSKRTNVLANKTEIEYFLRQVERNSLDKGKNRRFSNGTKQLYYKYLNSNNFNTISNLSPGELVELQMLGKDASISIMKSDKSNSIVVLDREKNI